jgi:hypothetical protein
MLLMANFAKMGSLASHSFWFFETAQNGSITRLIKPLGQWALAINPTI